MPDHCKFSDDDKDKVPDFENEDWKFYQKNKILLSYRHASIFST